MSKKLWLSFIIQFVGLIAYSSQTKIDSLKEKLSRVDVQEKREVLTSLTAYLLSQPDSVIAYAQQLIDISQDDKYYLASAYFYMGQALKDKGNYEQSIDYLYKSLKLKLEINEKTSPAETLLATVYGRIGDMEKSSLYFHRLIKEFHQNEDSNRLIQAYNNFGEAFYQNNQLDSAYYYFSIGVEHAKEAQKLVYTKFLTGNLGMVNLKIGRLDSAEVQLRQIVDYLVKVSDAKLTFQILLAEVYMKKKQVVKAISLTQDVIAKSNKGEFKEQLRDGYKLLSQLYEIQGDYENSLKSYKEFIELDNSLKDIEVIRKIGDMKTEFEVGQKQAELDLVNAERDKERLITIGISLLAAVLLILGLVILKYYRQKTKTNEELERLNQTKDKFFSIISHDLRGPVSSFFGISRMIKSLVNRQQTEQLLAIADDIDESVDRLSALLDNLLNWAMQQQGHFPNVPEKVDLNEVAEDLIRTLDTMAKGKQIDLQAQIEQPIYLWVDKNTTMTILRNLVNNALKFTPDGGSVTISASKNADQAVIEVIDSGVGIPQEKLKNLFQLQDKKSTYGTSGEKGLGLGLQLVYEFVEMNGGKIEVSSQELVGTTFTVTLPLYDLEEEVIAT
ncbi:ATP-binding protein [Marinoscillum pacificum]|uniref:ATP-binding protein n=1 Tax=Marinoscillum pacificum TaxID=392723 RepID=UPI002157B5A5|nr:ATP-binding protein [Marinoscillum pacificum]